MQGQVTIGPLVPVVREGTPEPTPSPEVYAAWKIMVYRQDGRTLVRQVDIGPAGRYEVRLPDGVYVVDVTRRAVGGAKGLPKQVQVRAGQTAELNIDIDTGIR